MQFQTQNCPFLLVFVAKLILKCNKKAVAYLQTQNCYNINRAILFISAGNDQDGDKIYPFSMTQKDLFDNDLQLKQLFDNINAPRGQRKTKKRINSIVVDPFKVIFPWPYIG